MEFDGEIEGSWVGCQHKLLTRSRIVQWHVTVWPCWINTNFVIEDEHVYIACIHNIEDE